MQTYLISIPQRNASVAGRYNHVGLSKQILIRPLFVCMSCLCLRGFPTDSVLLYSPKTCTCTVGKLQLLKSVRANFTWIWSCDELLTHPGKKNLTTTVIDDCNKLNAGEGVIDTSN